MPLLAKTKTKIKHNIKHKIKHKSRSGDICNSSNNLLKQLSTPTLYNKYKTYISNISHKFTISQTNILSKLFDIKNSNEVYLSYKIHDLDETTQIPPFIDIFKYLITQQEFISKFTPDEQMQLLNKFALYIPETIKPTINTTNTKNKIKYKIYKYLAKSKLGNKLLKTYQSISSALQNELNTKYPSLQFHSLLINNFTSLEIIEDLELRMKKIIIFSFHWNSKKYDNLVYLYLYDDTLGGSSGSGSSGSSGSGSGSGSSNNKYIEKLGYNILLRILFFNILLDTDVLPNKFIIFLTDKKKEIDDDVISHMHFKTININSAVTNGHDIIIYREQELLKSIFHELIHFHNMDFRAIPKTIIEYLIKTHNIKPDNEYLLYECVTETLANIFNNIFISRDINEFNRNLTNEILFSTMQVAKILKICKYKTWNEFALLKHNEARPKLSPKHKHTTTHTTQLHLHNDKTHFKQDSCVLSYYILKFYIMLNLDTYFKSCLDTKLMFIKTENSFNSLINIFDTSRNNIELLEIINSILSNKSKKSNLKGNKTNKTLRMTCLESKLL